MADKQAEARAASGALMAYEEIVNALRLPITVDTTLEEDDFTDPAALPEGL